VRPRLRLASTGLVAGLAGWTLTGPLARLLPAPPLLAPQRWRVWLESTDPVTATATLLRLGGVAVAGWLALGLVATALVATTANASVRTRRSARTLHAAGRALHAAVPRPLLTTAALLLGAASAGCARPPGGGRAPPLGAPGPSTAATVTMAPTGAAPTGVAPAYAPVAAPPPGPPVAAPPPPGWVVHRGDSMWKVAGEVVASRGGTGTEVGRYWVALVRDNPRPDPDLVYPGQVLDLPPYPP
jgi:nucleoid-associated protein YgaU